jgi:hypothetical protein
LAKSQISIDLGRKYTERVVAEKARLGMKNNAEVVRHIVVNYFVELDKLNMQVEAALKETADKQAALARVGVGTVSETSPA